MGRHYDDRRLHSDVSVWGRCFETLGIYEGRTQVIWRSVTLISCGVIGGWLGFMASDRQLPVRYYSTTVLNSPEPGEPLRIKSVVWRDRSCNTSVYRAIFDHEDHRYVVPQDLEFPAGILPTGGDTFVVPVPVSPQASPGDAIYRVVRKYRCNPLHWIFPIEDGPHNISFKIVPLAEEQ